MISIQEAKKKVAEFGSGNSMRHTPLPLRKCLGKVLQSAVKSRCDSPPFDQSAMDGYAVCFPAEKKAGNLRFHLLNAEIKAGDSFKGRIKPGEALRIFTGAPIPKGCDAVIAQENITVMQGGTITCADSAFTVKGANIRLRGSQFRKGEVLLTKGMVINAARIAIAAMGGHEKLTVPQSPGAFILVTGNELSAPGTRLPGGSIYESNSVMLEALLAKEGIEEITVRVCRDERKSLLKHVSAAIKKTDIVLISGGISVGKYDLVKEILHQLKVETIFYKVKQKPGKPLYFGRKGRTAIFGLPGNPAASMTCFYEYVLPYLEITGGRAGAEGKSSVFAKLSSDYSKKSGLTHFLKGKLENGNAHILPDQESYKLTSFSDANCLVVIPEESSSVKSGSLVECHLLH